MARPVTTVSSARPVKHVPPVPAAVGRRPIAVAPAISATTAFATRPQMPAKRSPWLTAPPATAASSARREKPVRQARAAADRRPIAVARAMSVTPAFVTKRPTPANRSPCSTVRPAMTVSSAAPVKRVRSAPAAAGPPSTAAVRAIFATPASATKQPTPVNPNRPTKGFPATTVFSATATKHAKAAYALINRTRASTLRTARRLTTRAWSVLLVPIATTAILVRTMYAWLTTNVITSITPTHAMTDSSARPAKCVRVVFAAADH